MPAYNNHLKCLSSAARWVASAYGKKPEPTIHSAIRTVSRMGRSRRRRDDEEVETGEKVDGTVEIRETNALRMDPPCNSNQARQAMNIRTCSASCPDARHSRGRCACAFMASCHDHGHIYAKQRVDAGWYAGDLYWAWWDKIGSCCHRRISHTCRMPGSPTPTVASPLRTKNTTCTLVWSRTILRSILDQLSRIWVAVRNCDHEESPSQLTRSPSTRLETQRRRSIPFVPDVRCERDSACVLISEFCMTVVMVGI